MIGVAVLGAGHWGPHLIRNFHNFQDSVVHWVADLDDPRLKEVATRFPSVSTTTDALTAIADPRVDAVVVATPTTTHHRLARLALDQGKHVLVEKPLATSVALAEELRALAAAKQRVLMVGHLFVYNAGVRAVKRCIDAGEVGRIYYVSMNRTNLGPVRVDVNAAWDLAAHDVSIANYWLGAEPESVSALGGTWINSGLEDAVFATLRYPDGILVNVLASWLSPRKNRDITVVGERRMLFLDDMNIAEPLRIYDKGVTDERTHPSFTDTFASFRASIREGAITIPKVALGEPLKVECDHFIECVRAGRTPDTSAEDGVAVIRALEAIDRSLRNDGRAEAVRR